MVTGDPNWFFLALSTNRSRRCAQEAENQIEKKKKQCTYVLYLAWNLFRRTYDFVFVFNRGFEFPLSRNAQKRNKKNRQGEQN
jgi:hypothetical protein